jgi:hypothetical protein
MVYNTIKKVFCSIFEGIETSQRYRAKGFVDFYLSQSVDHADLECRTKQLKAKGLL